VGPLAQSDGHDSPGLIDELVPGVAAFFEDLVVGFEDPVREPVVAHELPDVFLRVQLRAQFRQGPGVRRFSKAAVYTWTARFGAEG